MAAAPEEEAGNTWLLLFVLSFSTSGTIRLAAIASYGPYFGLPLWFGEPLN